MEINDEIKKVLRRFAKYVIANELTKVCKQVDYDDFDGGVEENSLYDSSWRSKKIDIETIEYIDDLILRVIESSEEIEYFFDEHSGYIDVCFDTEKNIITFELTKYVTQSNEIGSVDEDIDENHKLYEWFEEMRNNGYKHCEVGYSGGGDSGYIDDRMVFDNGERKETPASVAEWIGDNLTYNWWDNEGGQGSYHFDFVMNNISASWEENFDGEESETAEIIIDFN